MSRYFAKYGDVKEYFEIFLAEDENYAVVLKDKKIHRTIDDIEEAEKVVNTLP